MDIEKIKEDLSICYLTVKIPKENILNADTIENLIKKAAEEGIL